MKKILLTFLLLTGTLNVSAQGAGGEIRLPSSLKKTQSAGKKSSNAQKPSSAKKNDTGYDGKYYFNKGFEYFNKGNYAESFKWMKKSGEKGFLEGKFMLGYMYEKALGVDRNETLAEKWYDSSIPTMYNSSMQSLSLDDDDDVSFDLIRITSFFPYCVWATFQLGAVYYWGNCGYSTDYKEAVRYFEEAAGEGCRAALYYLGICYEYGRGVQKNSSQAAEYYKLSGYSSTPSRFFTLENNGIWPHWNGYYKETDKKGITYEGYFRNGKYNGKGTMTWPSGAKYVGNYVNGLRHGKGTYTYPNGDEYDGEWQNNERTGEGTYYYHNHTYEKGVYKDNKLINKTEEGTWK